MPSWVSCAPPTWWTGEARLDGPLPDPSPPPGIEIRPFDPAREARTAHAVITEAFTGHFGWVARTFDEWAATNIELPSFDASLWFLATDGDETVGALAG